MDPVLTRLRAEIAGRGDEILHARTPGFLPQHDDVQARPRVVPSDNPLHVTAPPDARFILRDRDGRQGYSRDGMLSLRDGVLTGSGGRPVLGYAPGGGILTELRAARQDVILDRIRNPHFERDGTFVYERSAIDPHSQFPKRERVVAGRLALARFPAGSDPVRSGGIERAPIGVQPLTGRPGDGTFGVVMPGEDELGAIDLNRALARLHDAYQQLDAVAAARRAARQTGKTALDLVK